MPTIQDMPQQCECIPYATVEFLRRHGEIPTQRHTLWKTCQDVNGVKNIGGYFQRKSSMVFLNMQYVLVYINNTLVITKGTYVQHLQAVGNVL